MLHTRGNYQDFFGVGAMKITVADVEYVARLARLELTAAASIQTASAQ